MIFLVGVVFIIFGSGMLSGMLLFKFSLISSMNGEIILGMSFFFTGFLLIILDLMIEGTRMKTPL